MSCFAPYLSVVGVGGILLLLVFSDHLFVLWEILLAFGDFRGGSLLILVGWGF